IEEADLRDVMDEIGRRVGRNIIVEPGVQASVSSTLKGIPWRAAVEELARQANCQVEERGAIIVLTRPQASQQQAQREMQEQIDTLTAQKNGTEDDKVEAGRKFDNERRQKQVEELKKGRRSDQQQQQQQPPLGDTKGGNQFDFETDRMDPTAAPPR